MKRKKIPKLIREAVWARQKGKCALCMEIAREAHHIDPVFLGGKNSYSNIVYLCYDHHKLLHLGDPDTCMRVYEYSYYLVFNKLPDDPYNLQTAEKVIESLRNS